MSGMERRLQLLLDQDRYRQVADEADRSGRSVAAVIREAIDVRFPAGRDHRGAALTRFLQRTEQPSHSQDGAQGWAEIKSDLEHGLSEELSR